MRRSARVMRQVDEGIIERQFRIYPTLIAIDMARGGGTAKLVRKRNSRAHIRAIGLMLLAISPFMTAGLLLTTLEDGPRPLVALRSQAW